MQGIEFVRDLAVVMVIAGAVGWLFQRLRLSVVVGYLIAGIIVGPFTPPFALVSDLDRIQTLSQLGLIFLIFSIGLGLSFALVFCFAAAYVTSERDAKIDFSYFRTARAGDATKKLVRALDKPLHVYLFFPPANEVREASDHFPLLAELR